MSAVRVITGAITAEAQRRGYGLLTLGKAVRGAPPCVRCSDLAQVEVAELPFCAPCLIQVAQVGQAVHVALEDVEATAFFAAEEAGQDAGEERPNPPRPMSSGPRRWGVKCSAGVCRWKGVRAGDTIDHAAARPCPQCGSVVVSA